MATFVVPALDARPWPTLGPELCDWIEAHLVYGPGDMAGLPYRVSSDFRAWLYRAYEVFPRGHEQAGRRRFKQAYMGVRKGLAKTEDAAIVAAGELHPSAPVRCDGFRRVGREWVPVGRGVQHPYVPLVSTTVEQTEDLAFAVLRYILGESAVSRDFDVGLDRILVLDQRGGEAGKAVALAGSPDARDGARTTFQHFDEPHRMRSRRVKLAHTAMLENLYKRRGADAWSMYTSTAGVPGEHSLAEDLRDYAQKVAAGKVRDPRLFWFERFAPLDTPLTSPAEVRHALLEATGPNDWSADIDALVSSWGLPTTDQAYFCRVWLNQWRQSSAQAFDMARVVELSGPGSIKPGALIVAGFDGSLRRDATALVIEDVESGLQELAGLWERPDDAPEDWEVPQHEVDAAVDAIDKRYQLWRLHADPHRWATWIDAWAGRYGSDRIVKFDTTKPLLIGPAMREYAKAIATGEITFVLDDRFLRHIGNALLRRLEVKDPAHDPNDESTDPRLWTLAKDAHHSRNWIDAAMASVLCREARRAAVAAGARKKTRAVVHSF